MDSVAGEQLMETLVNDSVLPLEIVLAMPRGFCAGVERAIETVHLSLKKYNSLKKSMLVRLNTRQTGNPQ